MRMKDIKRLYKKATHDLVEAGTKKVRVSTFFGDKVITTIAYRWEKKPHDEGSLKQFARKMFLNFPTSDERKCALADASPKVLKLANTCSPLRKVIV